MQNKLTVSERTLDFAVPGGAGAYAPEVLYLNRDNLVTTGPDEVGEMQLLVAALPTSAIVEVDLCAPGSGFGGTVRTAVQTYNALGLTSVLSLAGWRGVRIRVKSGGTSGTATVDASWW